MYSYKIYNNIAQEGIDTLKENGLKEDQANPDALLLRSQVLNESDFNDSLNVSEELVLVQITSQLAMPLIEVLLFLILQGQMQMLLRS